MRFHIGKRIIKTAITLFLIFLIYIALLYIDKLLGIPSSSFKAPSNMYTPFFAGIAAVFATHRDKKSSIKQAKVRSIGSLIGGIYGMLLIYLSEFILIDLLNMYTTLPIFAQLIHYTFTTLAIIPLIVVTVKLKQIDGVFITCLTFLSVTVSQRNGGMPVLQFASNRILSTLIGVGVSLVVNNYLLSLKRVNKDTLFVASLENNFLSKDDELTPFMKYKLNDLFEANIPLVFATTRTTLSFEYIFENININYPMVIMNGAAKYRLDKKRYSNVQNIDNDTRIEIDKLLKELNMNAYVYTINDHVLHAYHNILKNDGELLFFKHRKHHNAYTFVRGELPLDLNANMYVIIDTKDNIDNFISKFNNKNVDLITYMYKEDINGKDYWYLKITNSLAKKENYVNSIKEENNLTKLIVSGSGRTDLPLIRQADLSLCLDTAPSYIKDEVDIIIHGNAETVLRIYDKLYHSKNIDKEIEKLKIKYKS